MVNELILMWLSAFNQHTINGEWKIIWSFDKYFPHEPWVNITFWLFTALLVVINLVIVGYRLARKDD